MYSGLTPNTQYSAKVYARRASSQLWYLFEVQFTATATPLLGVGSPTHLQALTQPIPFWGWAIDGAAPTGTGVTAIDVWSYPNPGSGTAPQYLGAATYGGDMPGVAAAYGARFRYSGYGLSKSGLTPGEYIFLTYAYSPTSGWFVQTSTNYVNIPTVQLTVDRQGTGTGAVTASGLTCAGGPSAQAVPCSASYPHNTVITLTAVPDSDSLFRGWGGACTGLGTCQVTMANARFVRALFKKVLSTYTTQYYHTDVSGSVRLITNQAAEEVSPRHDYSAFGEDEDPLTGNPVRFSGKQLDPETGHHLFENRYYRNIWGRFTQPDPVAGSTGDPQTFNRYSYALNNPLSFGDPDGLQTRPRIPAPVYRAETNQCQYSGTWPNCGSAPGMEGLDPSRRPPNTGPTERSSHVRPWAARYLELLRGRWPRYGQTPPTPTQPPPVDKVDTDVKVHLGTPAEQKQVKDAIKKAIMVVDKNEVCAGRLGGKSTAFASILNTPYTLINEFVNGNPRVPGAVHPDRTILIPRAGLFFTFQPNPTIFGPEPFKIKWQSQVDFQSAVILNEQAHVLSQYSGFKPDVQDVALGLKQHGDFTQQCF